MKKLLVLLMVLGLATSAQAALTLSLSATQIGVSEIATLTVNSDDTANWQNNLVLSEDTYAWTSPLAADWGTGTATGIGDLGAITYDAAGYHAVINVLVATSQVPTNVVAGNQFVIDITGVQAGTIYISLQNGAMEEQGNGPLTLVVIPEPMTLGLLGLGGLFLRRRK